MRPISSTDTPILSFKKESGSQKVKLTNSKIAWLHTLSDQPGAKFDIVIKDQRGGVRFSRKGFGTETVKAGELINLAVLPGEEMEVEVNNLQGAEKVDVFLN